MNNHKVNSSTVKAQIIESVMLMIQSAERALIAAETALNEMENLSCASEHDMCMRDDVLNHALDSVESAREVLGELRGLGERIKNMQGSQALAKAKRDMLDMYTSVIDDSEEVVGMNEMEREVVADEGLWRFASAA